MKSILLVIGALVAPIILVVVGVCIIGLAIYMNWEWMMNVGIFVVILGIIWTARVWWVE